jgi:hypothetical protein
MGIPGQKPGNGPAVAALVLGIVAIALFCIWYIALPCAILAIIFGVVGRGKARAGASGGGMATAGVVCGVISLCLLVVIIGLVCAGVSMMGADGLEEFRKAFEEAAQQATQPTTAPTGTAP